MFVGLMAKNVAKAFAAADSDGVKETTGGVGQNRSEADCSDPVMGAKLVPKLSVHWPAPSRPISGANDCCGLNAVGPKGAGHFSGRGISLNRGDRV